MSIIRAGKMNYLDLFSGIGGFALGAYWAGFKCDNHFFSEIDKYCGELYQKRFPNAIPLGDITKIDCEELKKYGNEWIISGGFPCQDISIAGKGAGLAGARSGLWFEYWRIIRDIRPRFAIMENVSALSFRGLDRVLGSLNEIGYNAEWETLSACQFGLPHRRKRMWIIAYPQSVYDLWGNKKKKDWSLGQGQKPRRCCRENPSSIILRGNDGLHGNLDRLKGLGNAIVPQISQLLFQRIMELL